ncbi:MAG: wax ester/triacylglycerol synthase family O-acyltransferase [Sphingomonas bacterium]|uniref:WS/DGAT/MGAT family O-acyltransferase n=1 Tax=Sphingomonas bacterium TaxID=1895847 RepID=UPI00261469EB|nr:wax ester/triacylglycerol synthase family O-acyltransferase [Sphingomonas bacterium]MDB5710547.1 wax ester/triacylglycerol synthase family O-acyltransferase [Sphingomonas bacterium]
MLQLSGQDASFVYLETPHTPMHIGSVGIYDPSTAPGEFVRFKDVLNFIGSRLGGARSFRQRLVRVPFDLDHPYWIEDPEFDIEFHVRHIALPKPGDWRQLCIQVARLHARPMDLSKPLWEFTIVEGLDNIPGLPPGCFALVSKVHHAAIDGMSGVEMSAAVHDLDASMTPPKTQDDWRPEHMPNVADLLARSYFNSLTQPMRVIETIGRSLPGMAKLTAQVSKGDVSIRDARAAPKTRFNGKVGAHRVFDAVPLKLAEIRAIKETVEGATVNDVILAIVGGGLRAYLGDKGELPAETMTAMAPISVRGEGEKAALGNLVSAMVVGLGTHIADPVERLRFVHDAAVNSKAMTNAVGAKTLADYSQLIPSGLAGLAARLYTRVGAANAHAPVFNCVVTNVPGSRVPLYFCGAKMVAMYGTGPVFDGMGLINPIYSYGDTIAISFTSDRDMMPDPENYAAALRASFDALKEATLGKAAPAAKVPPRPAKQPAAPKAVVAAEPAAKPKTKSTPATKKPAAAVRKPALQKKGAK